MAWHDMTGWHKGSSVSQHIIQSWPLCVDILPAAHCLGLPSVCVMQVTHNVACLARWMAADLYLREVDVLRFEVTMFHNLACDILTDLMLDTISVLCKCVLQFFARGHSFCAAYFTHTSYPFFYLAHQWPSSADGNQDAFTSPLPLVTFKHDMVTMTL